MNLIKRLSFIFSIFMLIVFFLTAPAAISDTQKADKVYINGNVYTVDKKFSKVTAFAVKDGKFIYVGDDEG
ncbi:MAG: amidohydrolase, partial [Candidatus Aminicenantes bacterium]|nr:amidohydrolase [Candidatus Aminicenantes bacterium]